MKLVNLTPHSIRMRDPLTNRDWLVEPSGLVISAGSRDRTVSRFSDGSDQPLVQLVETEFLPNPEEAEKLAQLHEQMLGQGRYLLIGSTLAAQAYPGQIVSLIPIKGLERVPTAQRVARSDKFRIFSKEKK